MLFLPVLCLVFGTALFTACGQSLEPDAVAEGKDLAVQKSVSLAVGNDHPVGTWESAYGEDFTINTTLLEYGIGTQLVFSGTFQGWVDDTDDDDSGIVFLQYTYAPYGVKGNFYAVRWERLSLDEGTVWLSGCADADGKPTLKEAMAEYTEANKDKYFAYGSDCKRISAKLKGLKTIATTTEKPPYLKYLEEKTGIILF